MTRLIIGLTGAAGSGKSAAAEFLRTVHGFRHTRFAGPLKAMIHALGVPWECIDGDRKEEPLALLGGATARVAMQTLGTEWGRELIHPDIWVRAWQVSLPMDDTPIVVDDVRFANESDIVREMGGVVIEIKRPDLFMSEGGHASEAGLAGEPDYVITNDGTLDDLQSTLSRWRELIK